MMKIVQLWITSSLKKSIAWSKVASICISLDYLPIPNYQDVTTFFLVDEYKGLFYFNASLLASSLLELQKRIKQYYYQVTNYV